ncbi:hypothetical protein [Streptomyces sp.]|uniref:hypothetical protein n=1 Tax=Streptomyces sp. TaxID=1931 RepID=UPI0039C8E5D1
MDTQQITAPPRAQPAVSGVIHNNVRHTAGFTVIGNHLAQHRGLSLVAIGLAVHIQSLPAGAKIGIKLLADRFPESETHNAALPPPPLPGTRELESARPGAIVIPLQNCDRCGRAFRSRHPGHCRDCRTDLPTAA